MYLEEEEEAEGVAAAEVKGMQAVVKVEGALLALVEVVAGGEETEEEAIESRESASLHCFVVLEFPPRFNCLEMQ